MRRIASIGATLLASALIVAAPAPADAAPPPPPGLEVVDGGGWRSDQRFAVTWTALSTGPPIAAAHYLVTNQDGAVVSGPVEIAIDADRHTIEFSVPTVSGAYDAAVWLEDSTGAEGPPATVKLLYDRARPGFSQPLPPSGWISGNELPYTLRIAHPAGPVPLSGIRGYAVSVDGDSEASPCLAVDRCTDDEIDLRLGIEGDAFAIAHLPEGRSFFHAVAVSGSGMRSVTPGHAAVWVDRTDPVTRLSGAPAGWADRPVTLEATATDSASGMAVTGDGAPFTAIQVDDGPPIVSPGSTAAATLIAGGIHTVAYYARDAAGNVNDGGSVNGHRNATPPSVQVRIDRDPPGVAFTGSPDPDEPELIEARVVDALSGPDPTRGQIALRAAGSEDRFEPLPTAGRGGTLRAHWSSEAYPEGEYEFRATGFDLAGNATASTRRLNGSPMVLPNPLKARTTLAAWLSTSTRYARSNRQSALVGGRLIASSDLALVGRPVRIVERFDPGATMRARTAVVETDEHGRFKLRLAPGPSREVQASFAGTATAMGSTSRPLRLGVRSSVELQASARVARVGGRPVVFRGVVGCSPADGAAPCSASETPSGGVSVQLQFRAPGLAWTEFRTLYTDRRGRFRYSYRFNDDDSRGVRFRFRAVVPTQNDWPYEPGGSRPVAVLGA